MADGPTVEETIVRLKALGATVFEWRCTPADLEALVIGRLFIEGLVDNADLPAELKIAQHADDEIEITWPEPIARGQNRLRTAVPPRIPESEEFGDLFRVMFTTVEARYESGGMHAAAMASGGRIAFQAEDVGRHNTIDKVIGMALLAGLSPTEFGMLVTARVSGEIARKAARSGVTWLASRSIPTTLAVRVAREAGMPIVGRAAGKNAFIYQ